MPFGDAHKRRGGRKERNDGDWHGEAASEGRRSPLSVLIAFRRSRLGNGAGVGTELVKHRKRIRPRSTSGRSDRSVTKEAARFPSTLEEAVRRESVRIKQRKDARTSRYLLQNPVMRCAGPSRSAIPLPRLLDLLPAELRVPVIVPETVVALARVRGVALAQGRQRARDVDAQVAALADDVPHARGHGLLADDEPVRGGEGEESAHLVRPLGVLVHVLET